MNFDDPTHIFIIAEAGSNWKCGSYEDDLNQSKNLIKYAAKAGADAVKFQIYRPETTYVSNPGGSKSLSYSENIDTIFEKHAMPYEMIPKLVEFCKEENILFMASSFSVEDAKAINPFTQIHKVASFEINHIKLLEFLATTKKPILVSTGSSNYDEIDFCVNILKENGCDEIILLQCTSKYPCSMESLNLSVIPKMKSKYNLPIGFSDHSTDPIIAPLVSIGLGATVIEKHFTIDKNLSGPDHSFALTPDELKQMIDSIRNTELAYGTGKKEILQEELETRKFAKRSLQAITNISRGDILELGLNFDILRPGDRIRGLDARFLFNINGKKSKLDVVKGDGINEYE
jgi:N,N'-diacetyllegionaminate synthase